MIVPSGTDSDCIKPEARVLVDAMFLQKIKWDPIIINRKYYLLHVKITVLSED
jgi:hypothetical protein